LLEDEQLLSLDVAASQLGVPTKDLRTYLQKQRPKGGVQIPNKPGGNWHLQPALLTQLGFAGAPGLNAPLVPISDETLDSLDWSEWIPFAQAANEAPALPGVYMFRQQGSDSNPPLYIGAAGERNGKGVRGRLRIYSSGKGATSGLGKHAMDRALADPAWVKELLQQAEAGTADKVESVARRAIDRLDGEIRWVTCVHRKAAIVLESALLKKHAATVWNVVGVPKDADS